MDASQRTLPRRWLAPAVVLLLSTIWGTTYFAIARGLEDLPPFTSVGTRFVGAAILMAILAAVVGRREEGDPPGWTLSIVQGIANFGISYGIVYWSETVLPSGLVSVLWATFPMMMAVGGHFFLPEERLRRAQWSGLGVAFLGVAVLFLTDIRAIGPAAIPAALILLLSPASSVVGHIVIKRQAHRVRSLLLNRNGMIIGASLHVLLVLLWELDEPMRWTATAIGSVAYLTIIGTVVTFALYFWAMRTVPAYQLSLIAFLTPGLALVTGTVWGNEPFGLSTLAGTGLILAGVALVLKAPKRPKESPS